MVKKWSQFILESNFLKSVGYLGYVDLSMYRKVDFLNLIEKHNSKDWILEGDDLLFNFDNVELEEEINKITFKEEVENIFNVNFLNSCTRTPIDLGHFKFNDLTELRVNHYLIKSNDSTEFKYGEVDGISIRRFVKNCIDELNKMGIKWEDRYCYLTIDQNLVVPGKTQREEGWHIDGMQGDEVVEKKQADFQFIWADEIPTKFCTQIFDISNMNPSIHNVFNYLGKQVKENYCYMLEKNKIYLMNPYHLHTATKSDKKTWRRFVRLSFTNTPITSVKMVVNPDMIYNYKIHQTTGNIPKNLI